MNTSATITFAAAAPIIAVVMGIVLNALPTKISPAPKVLPLIAVVLAAAYGAVLWQGGTFTGSTPEFIVTALTVGYAAAGIYQHGSTFSNVSFQNPFVVTPTPAAPVPLTAEQIQAMITSATHSNSTTLSVAATQLPLTAPETPIVTSQPPI